MARDTNELMLELLADVVHGRRPAEIDSEEWHDVLKEMYAQAVYSLPAEHIKALNLSAEEESAYMWSIIKNRKTFHALMKEQSKVLSLLQDAGVPVVVMKGAAAACNYSHPENRLMGDIDLLVQPQDFRKAYDVLVGAGLSTSETPEFFLRHIRMSTANDIEVELHYYFSTSDNSDQNKILDDILYSAITSRVVGECCGYSFPMLPPLENGLILLGHINQHLSTGLGLRQIIDWMFYVEKYVDDDFWNNGFAELADQIGMKRLAILTTAMCQKYLGLDKDIHWSHYEPVCDDLMEFILSQGNFGYKENHVKGSVVTILKHFRNPFEGLALMQRYGLIHWEAARKHACLKPFAWAYQLRRWITKGLKRGVNADVLNDASSSAKELTELIDKLGVTRL